jgi:peptidyl-prolyl cis-trans isomerase B (cyclophilin B)
VRIRAVEALGNIGSSAEAEEITRRLERCSGSRPEERAYIESSLVSLAKIFKGNSERFFSLTDRSRFAATAAIVWAQAAKESSDFCSERDRMSVASLATDKIISENSSNHLLSDAYCMTLAANRKNSTIAIMETNRGTLEIELFREDAPLTVDNFVKLAREGVYDDMEFAPAPQKRIVETAIYRSHQGFARDGHGEINLRPFERGSVGIALADRNSDTCRFFISFAPQPYLDGIQTCFGRVVSGMPAAEKLVAGDRIKRISIKETISFLNYRRY